MSISLITAAFKTALPSTHKFVFIALCDNANDQGECYPSVSMLAEKTSLSDRAVQKSLTFLCDAGYLVRMARNGRSTYYTIAMPSDWKEPTPEPRSPRTTFTPNNVHPTPEQCSPLPPNVVHPTPEQCSPITVNEPSLESSIEPPIKASKKKSDGELAIFDGIDPRVVQDFKVLRKRKSAPITETAMDGIVGQAAKAGMSLEDALRMCCERGWAGFRAEWVTRGDDRRSQSRDTPDRRGRPSINDFGSNGVDDDDPFNTLRKDLK